MDHPKIIISGATSLVADYLLPILNETGYDVVGLSRCDIPPVKGIYWQQIDFDNLAAVSQLDVRGEVFIHLAPLPAITKLFPLINASGVRKIVAIGTTSSITKSTSIHPKDVAVVTEQQHAEMELSRFAEESGVEWNIIRPTMVYDGFRDKNIAQIKRFIRRFGFAPLVLPGTGKRQPLHADDLARAIINLLNRSLSGKVYNLGGSEVLPYSEMLNRIFVAMGKTKHLLPLPRGVMSAALTAASLIPKYRYLNGAMADRMNIDMCFDNRDAIGDLGITPRQFEPGGDTQ